MQWCIPCGRYTPTWPQATCQCTNFFQPCIIAALCAWPSECFSAKRGRTRAISGAFEPWGGDAGVRGGMYDGAKKKGVSRCISLSCATCMLCSHMLQGLLHYRGFALLQKLCTIVHLALLLLDASILHRLLPSCKCLLPSCKCLLPSCKCRSEVVARAGPGPIGRHACKDYNI